MGVKRFLANGARARGKGGQPDLRDLVALRVEENRADQADPLFRPPFSDPLLWPVLVGAPAEVSWASMILRLSTKLVHETSRYTTIRS
jgi:hypothetical protein